LPSQPPSITLRPAAAAGSLIVCLPIVAFAETASVVVPPKK
jgi:hypothetical protein